jgi:drug/metabolite transporter (DMT)-like permease
VNRRAWLLFVTVSVLWGIPYLLIKIAVTDLSPLFVVVGRLAIAAAILVPVAAARGELRALRHRLGLVVTLAMLHIAAPFLLITYGELFITSSLTGLIIAVEPILIGLLLARAEPFTRIRVAGLVAGLAGVAALTGIELRGGGRGLLGAAMVLLATACYAAATVLVQRKASGVPPTALVAGTTLTSSLLLAPFAAFALPTASVSAGSWAALVLLGLACTAVALLAFYALIGAVGPNRAGLVTYVNPLVAVTLGVVVLNEPLRPSILLGAALILAGCWLSSRPARAARVVSTQDASPSTQDGSASTQEGAARAAVGGHRRGPAQVVNASGGGHEQTR